MQEEKSKLLKVRVSPDQLGRFRAAAEAESMTLSEWIRRLALLRVAELGPRVRPAS
jgi:hypothetical protein